LRDKIALITGASKGMGKEIALQFCEEGATVVFASRSAERLRVLSDQVNEKGGNAFAVSMDVTDPVSVQNAVDRTVQEFGRLDIMVNNAGVTMTLPSTDLTVAQWRRAVETDLFGVFYGCQSAGRQMIAQRGGCIINVSSIFGRNAAPMRAAYCSSKAAVDMLTRVLAVEWAEHHVRVNAIAPGYVRTELVQDLIERKVFALEDIEKRTPQRRIGEVDDIAQAAVFVASDAASFMTGSILTIDGGWSAYGYL